MEAPAESKAASRPTSRTIRAPRVRPLGPGIERTGGRDGDMRPYASSGLRP